MNTLYSLRTLTTPPARAVTAQNTPARRWGFALVFLLLIGLASPSFGQVNNFNRIILNRGTNDSDQSIITFHQAGVNSHQLRYEAGVLRLENNTIGDLGSLGPAHLSITGGLSTTAPISYNGPGSTQILTGDGGFNYLDVYGGGTWNLRRVENNEYRYALTVAANGNVGINNGNPGAKLHVSGDQSGNVENLYVDGRARISGPNAGIFTGDWFVGRRDNGDFRLHLTNSGDHVILPRTGGIVSYGPITFSNSSSSQTLTGDSGYNYLDANGNGWVLRGNNYVNQLFVNLGNGDMGIGTTNTGGFKLSVNGRARCEELQVVVDVPADYVFKSTYKLMPLAEVARYVQQNQHLPSIPSAAEIKQNGWNVAEMSNKLLEKVEELTLHLIAQNKLIADQQAELNELKGLKQQVQALQVSRK